jgi:hypothetical protein
MKTIAICGDSFSATSKTLPGTHYSELLAEKLGWQLLNYARRGCSNGAVRLQIQEAIRQNASFVVVVPTSWDRTEIPVRDNFYKSTANLPKKSWGNLLQDFLLDRSNSTYDSSLGIANINYDPSKTNNMIFETIFSLAENLPHEYRISQLTEEKVNAMKQYINHLYDSNWKRQMDQWIISEGLAQLQSHNIPFSIERGMLWNDRNEIKNTVIGTIPEHYIRQDFELIGTGCHKHPLIEADNDPGYHSEPEGQVWIANLYEGLIKKLYKIC